MLHVTVAIGAVPNTGKTTVFNRLTGSHQMVGNWPGVSVQKKVGGLSIDEFQVELVDLPGTYSVTPTSLEECVVRDYLLGSPPDLLLNVVDATNLYQGLGLTLQLAGTGIPMVVAMNMMDQAHRVGIEIDFSALSEHLGVAVVPIVARSGEGMTLLQQRMIETLRHPQRAKQPHLSWPLPIEAAISQLAREVSSQGKLQRLDENFVAMRLLEGGDGAARVIRQSPALALLTQRAQYARAEAEQQLGEDLPTACARCRFNSVRGLIKEVSQQPVQPPTAMTRRVDNFVLHPILGLPLFLLVMFLAFQGVYTLGVPIQDWLAQGVEVTQQQLNGWLAGVPWISKWVASFITEGIIQGVGLVVSFIPILALFFVFLAVIEDSGYMARAAFIMDRLMHSLRLDGKAFINILMGYGCNVPAVTGTRILSGQHNRILTMLLIPFSLCSGRLQVFLFLAALLFTPSTAPLVVFGLYSGSFLMIIVLGLLMRPFNFRGVPEPFIMELPSYRVPGLRVVAMRAWQEVREFVYRAATLVVVGVILVWLLTHLPVGVAPGSGQTLAGQMGQSLAFLFQPLGIDWQEVVALLSGVIAKEVVIGAIAVSHGISGDVAGHLQAHMSPLEGLSFMAFALFYLPCLATIAAIRMESGSWRVALVSLGMGLVTAWLMSFIVYQSGRALGCG